MLLFDSLKGWNGKDAEGLLHNKGDNNEKEKRRMCQVGSQN